jgi:spore germination protein
MVIGAFSVDGVVTRTWPTLDLMLEITGLIFERFESLLLVIWMMQMFSSFTIAYYATVLGLAQFFKEHSSIYVWIASSYLHHFHDYKKYQ